MKAKFVLESFDDYIKEMYPTINEFDDYGASKRLRPLTIEEARAITIELIENQSIRALANSKIKGLIGEIFGQEKMAEMKKYPGKWAGPSEGIVGSLAKADEKTVGGVKKKKEDFFKKIVEFDSRLRGMKLGKTQEENKNFRPAVIMGLFSQFMTDGSREELEKALSKRATELYIPYKKISKQIEAKGTDAGTMGQPPAILGSVSEEEVERVKVTPPTPPITATLLDGKQQSTLFLDNSWSLNPEVGKILRDKLSGVIERRKEGAYTRILDLSITSSASRYRNTKGKYGNAEALSWGQLAFKRAQVIHNMINEILKELQVPEGDPIRAELNKVAKMNIKGSNGDGTSGPNPLPDPSLGNLRVGYYETTTKQTKEQTGVSKFIDKDSKLPEKVYIVQIDDLGNTIGDPKISSMPLLKTKEEYDKYKFVNVVVNFEETTMLPGELGSVQINKVPEGTIAPQVILEKKGKKGEGGGWNFKWPNLPKINVLGWFSSFGEDICLVCHCGEF
jgi:hypothetical protein